MQVKIKDFVVAMEIKTSGIGLAIAHPSGRPHLGDLFVTAKGLIWCKGKTSRENGKAIKWKDFMAYMDGL